LLVFPQNHNIPLRPATPKAQRVFYGKRGINRLLFADSEISENGYGPNPKTSSMRHRNTR
jgi:hypothetical protein